MVGSRCVQEQSYNVNGAARHEAKKERQNRSAALRINVSWPRSRSRGRTERVKRQQYADGAKEKRANLKIRHYNTIFASLEQAPPRGVTCAATKLTVAVAWGLGENRSSCCARIYSLKTPRGRVWRWEGNLAITTKTGRVAR